MIHRLNDPRDFVDESDCASDVIQNRHLANLLPRIRYVFEKLHDCVRNIFESTKVYAFVVPKLAVAHVTMVFDDLSNMFGW
jgi:hypothetical protein